MGAARIVVLIVAALAAIGLALVVRQMTARPAAPPPVAAAPTAAPAQPMVRVLVAKRDLRVGERLEPADLGWQPWPEGSVNAAFITNGAAEAPPPQSVAEKAVQAAQALQAVAVGDPAIVALRDSIVREPILANEPVIQRKLVRGGEGGYMAVTLQPGMRAMSVPVSVENGAGGFILPADRVDVIMTQKVDVREDGQTVSRGVSRTIMRNLKVLAIDQATVAAAESPALVGAVATLEVPAADVEYLARARTDGELQLVLRAYSDAGGPAGRAAGAADGPGAETVRVYRNGQVSEARVP